METETIDLDDLSVILEDMYIDILKEESTEDLSRKWDENVRDKASFGVRCVIGIRNFCVQKHTISD